MSTSGVPTLDQAQSAASSPLGLVSIFFGLDKKLQIIFLVLIGVIFALLNQVATVKKRLDVVERILEDTTLKRDVPIIVDLILDEREEARLNSSSPTRDPLLVAASSELWSDGHSEAEDDEEDPEDESLLTDASD